MAEHAWLMVDDAGDVDAPLSADLEAGGRLLGWPDAARRPHRLARECDPRLLDPAGGPALVSVLWPGRRALPLFDDPAVVQARRAALAGPWPRAAGALVVDSVHFAGSVWVSEPDAPVDDPFRVVGTPVLHRVGPGVLGRLPRPAGPSQERYAGKPWPADGW